MGALVDAGNGSLLGYGCYSPFGSAELAQQLQQSGFGYKAQAGVYRDSEVPAMVSVGSQAYVPAAPTYTAPMPYANGSATPYQPMGGNPVSGAHEEDDDDLFDANGKWKAAGTVQKGLYTGAKNAEAALDFAASFNPIYQWGEILAGQTASGHKVSAGQRIFGLGLMAAGPILHHVASNAEGFLDWLLRRGCFVAGTPVQVARQDSKGNWHVSTKPIEQVKQGEIVLARSESTGQVEYKKVLSTSVREVDMVLAVTLADAKTGQAVETITATREHPFAIEGKGFVPAGGLAIGNSIVTRAGPALVVKDIKWLRRAEGYSVYNFVVDDHHTYFVGNAHGGVWVHNGVRCPKSLYKEPTRYRKGMRAKVWEAAKDEHGIVRDPTTNQAMNPANDWDMGHKSGWEYERHVESAEARGSSRKEFLDEYHDPSHYQPEIPGPNRSRRGKGPFSNWPHGPSSRVPYMW